MKLVLLHPLPLDGSIWPTARWGLADAVVAPTLCSIGASLKGWAEAAVDLAGSDDLVVVGNSVGGSCALEVASLAPARVRSLVLVGAKAGVRPTPAFRDEAVRVLRHEGVDAAWDRYWAHLFAPDADPDTVEHARSIERSIPVEHHVNGVRAFHNRLDRAGLLAELDIPVAIVRGQHDTIPKNPEYLASTLRNGRFIEPRSTDPPLKSPP
ncbi:MAG TPA: alpha/beta fold hydrolase [Acidimicrobiales bacterium]|nr:alpha/beta fold hydrolase [Acidimicrobiales bacterium]